MNILPNQLELVFWFVAIVNRPIKNSIQVAKLFVIMMKNYLGLNQSSAYVVVCRWTVLC